MLLVRGLTMALPALSNAYGSSFYETFERITSAGWVLLSAASALLVAMLARSAGTPAAGMAWGAFAVAAVDTALSVVFAIEAFLNVRLMAPVTQALGHAPFSGAMLAMALAFDVLFWLVLVRLGRGRLTVNWTILYGALRGVSLLLALPSLMPYEMYREVVLQSNVLGPALTWGRLVMAAAHSVVVIFALVLVARTQTAAPDEAAPMAPPGKASPQRDMLVGGLWLGGGLMVTLVSFASASGGGRYLVTTGAIAYGLVRLIRGLMRMGQTS
jgi:hypothetical protein